MIKKHHRSITLIVFACVVLIVMAIVAVFVSLPSQNHKNAVLTLSHYDLSQTSFWEGADEAAITLTDEAELALSWTPTNTLETDTYIVKATDIIRQQTQNAQERDKSQPTPDNFQLTATELLSQVTQTALVVEGIELGVFTPEPTATLIPVDILQQNWVGQIEEEIGFSHPDIETVIVELTSTNSIELAQLNQHAFKTEIRRYDTEKVSYVALIIQTLLNTSPNVGKLLVFKINDNIQELVYEFSVGDSYFLLYGTYGELFDLNNNGLIDVALAHSSGTECIHARLAILELTENEIIDISPISEEQFDTQLFSYWIKNNNNDGILEIQYSLPFTLEGEPSVDTTTCMMSNDVFTYQWNGERYALVDRD